MAQKPSIPKGTRDFSPQEMVRRNYIFDTIKQVFQRYGYLPIETPAMETTETLLGKYGEEGDRLIFKIFPRGEKLKPLLQTLENIKKIHDSNYSTELNTANTNSNLLDKLSESLAKEITEQALRYDLTVPFARYVVQHQHEITFPFKRYQIQPVWRADRPQKGRYREFYQCDADVIGSNSLINEVELVQLIDDVFTRLNVFVTVKINNRKILQGICELAGINTNKFIDFITIIDKIDKIGEDGVNRELEEKGIILKEPFGFYVTTDYLTENTTSFSEWKANFSIVQSENQLSELQNKFININSQIGLKGIEEVNEVINKIKLLGLKSSYLQFDLSLARGLNYYTGAIFEVKANVGTLTSSICGGGRYDDLTGIFGLPNMSGVGISFGADRIYDVLQELNLFPESVAANTKLLFVTFGETEQEYCLPLLAQVRKAGINSEIYPDANAKMKKQMGYADDKKIPFVVIVGSDEMQSGMMSLKNMASGEQEKISIENIIQKLK